MSSRFNNYNKKRQETKVFTIDQIKDDFDMSMFVTRLIYTSISFDWICINKDGIQKGKINKYIEKLKVLGLVYTQNFVDVQDNLIEIMNQTYPNYYKNIDVKTCICYRRTETLKKLGSESLMAQLTNKWLDNETFLCHLVKMEQENKTQALMMSKIKKLELENFEREVTYPDGTIALKKTAKFWNLQLLQHRFKKTLLLEGVEETKMDMETIKKTKEMSMEEKQARYNLRMCGGVQE